jgi:hypothetical protein
MKSILSVFLVLLTVLIFAVATSKHKEEITPIEPKKLMGSSSLEKPTPPATVLPRTPQITVAFPTPKPIAVASPSPTASPDTFPKDSFFPDKAHLLKPITLSGTLGSGSVSITLPAQKEVWVFLSDDHKTVTVQTKDPDLKGTVPIDDTDFVALARENQSKREAEKVAKEKVLLDEISKIPVSVECLKNPDNLLLYNLTFKQPLPQPALVDKIVQYKLQAGISEHPDMNILVTAFLGDDVLNEKQYSGSMSYDPRTKQITNMTKKIHSGSPL